MWIYILVVLTIWIVSRYLKKGSLKKTKDSEFRSEYPAILRILSAFLFFGMPWFIFVDYSRGFLEKGSDYFLCALIVSFSTFSASYFCLTKVVLCDKFLKKARFFGEDRICLDDVTEIRLEQKKGYTETTISSVISGHSIKFNSYMSGYKQLNRMLSERCVNATKMFD